MPLATLRTRYKSTDSRKLVHKRLLVALKLDIVTINGYAFVAT